MLAARDCAKAGALNGGFMRFSWTIYPGPKAQVGWYLYADSGMQGTPLCGNPSMPLGQFEELIEGHRQHADFVEEVHRLNLGGQFHAK